ncbi:mannose-6-phosphate isomerase, class I [Citricoccus sp. SGAir0253]|uniref:mannose-6-phosphate isomerase, class I n=1 Tax=Citricoccus sp. SGAir0253 TaxID=2567881 RepID=UPI0010CD58B7|nr:mannose-6-phosphate isomerase, class I [Citricoccus sp. SGAir0253]QCU78649.1 mannose-6-phosphate isomerase, class I [Citricoccus sp. SGAir0253]
MFLLRNAVRDYAWGSTTLLAGLQGRTPTGRPEAEVWMGAHHGAPSGAVPVDAPAGDPVPLDELIARDPQAMLGEAARFGRLPYLVKLLAAGRPLSIQAHPTLDQARAGHAAEEAAGIPVDAAHRNYRDDNHKPEMVVALTPFAALCGFRTPQHAAASFERLAAVLADHADGGGADPAHAVAGLAARLRAGAIDEAFCALLDPAGPWAGGDAVAAAVAALRDAPSVLAEDLNLSTAVGIAGHCPRDPGVLVSVLLNRVDLAPGQAIHLPAGNVHAYLHGLGLEVMAASDNVVRGGLTPKHVDVPELRRVVRFEALPVPYCTPVADGPGHLLFRPPFEEFQLERFDLPDAEGRTLAARGPVIAVCTSGSVRVTTGGQAGPEAVLSAGESVFLGAADGPATVHGVDGDGAATLFSVTLP